MQTELRRALGYLILGACAFLWACEQVPTEMSELAPLAAQLMALSPARVPRLPSELAYITEHPDRFVAGASDPLAQVIPGTRLDDLADLSGCWGAVWKDEQRPLVQVYIVYQFDDQSGRYTYSLFQQDVFGVMPILAIESGRYVIVDEQHIGWARERSWYNDLTTGELIEDSIEPPAEPIAVLATLSGDQLILYPGADDMSKVPEDILGAIYQRFDCPH